MYFVLVSLLFIFIGVRSKGAVPVSFRSQAVNRLKRVLSQTSQASLIVSSLSLRPSLASDGVNEYKKLADRAMSDASSKSYNPGVKSNDALYPAWFAGDWDCISTTKSVVAPLGMEAFGGDSAWAAGQKDIGQTLKYQTRFVKTNKGGVVADRQFNIQSIASAAVGSDSIMLIAAGQQQQQQQADLSDRLAAEIRVSMAPNQIAGEIFDVTLTTIAREYYFNSNRDSSSGDDEFVCLEKVRQTISRRMDELMSPQTQGKGRVKDIETISLYRREGPDRVRAWQRTATFLSPLEVSSRYRELQGRIPQVSDEAVDIRLYDLTYTRTRGA
jgi:hypothetical protein